jgi:ATP-binding cassette, subfamily B, bacterial PglK
MRNFLSVVRKTLYLLGPQRHWRWAGLVALAIGTAAFEAVGTSLVYLLVRSITTPGDIQIPLLHRWVDPAQQASSVELQLWVAGLVALFFIVRPSLIIAVNFVQARMVFIAGAELASRLLQGYLAMPYADYTRVNSAALVRNAYDSVQTLVREVLRPAVDVITQVMLCTGLFIVLYLLAPAATALTLLILLPVLLTLQYVIQPRLEHLGRVSQEARRSALQAIQQALGGVRDVRLLGREERFAAAFISARRAMARAQYLRSTLMELPRTALELGLVFTIVAVLVLGVVTGDASGTAALLSAFAYAGFRLHPSLRDVVKSLNHIRFGSAVLEDLLADRQRADAVLAAQAQRRLTQAPSQRLEQRIELRDVSFAYGPDARPAVRDINLVIRKGEFVGICGPTGGGKSTLIDLMVGLIQPTSGAVLVDGKALGEHPAWWYAVLGVVSQNVYLLDDTLRRNIAFGCRDEEIDEELLQRCIVRAQLETVIANLPDGLDTMTGERGVRLSGGQRQRVAVARALYREPSVIVFDEGTAALDAATEAALVAALDELKAGRTLISVAHRIATVRHADRIIVVQDGRIADSGTYDELWESSHVFRAVAG